MDVNETQVEPVFAGPEDQHVQELTQLLHMQCEHLGHIAQSLPINTTLNRICQDIEATLTGSLCYVMYTHPVTGLLTLKSAPSFSAQHHDLFNKVKPGEYARACGTAVFTDQPVFCTQIDTDPRWQQALHIGRSLKIEAAWAYPLRDTQQRPNGVIGILFNTPRTPTTRETYLLKTAANLCQIALNQSAYISDLAAAERRLAHVASSLPGILLQAEFTDKGLPYLSFVSEGIETLCGVTTQEAYTNFHYLWQCIPDPEQQHILALMRRRTPDSQELWSLECRIISRDGHIKWVYLAATPKRQPNGRVVSVNCMLLDISREKDASAQLALAGVAFQATNEGIVVIDSNNRIINANRAFCVMTGYNRAELLGKTPHLFSGDTTTPQQVDAIFELARKAGNWQGELWQQRKNGACYPQWMNIDAVYNKQNEITHFVLVVADVSDIKNSEARLRHLAHHDALTELPNRKLFKILVDHAIDTASDAQQFAVLMIDLDRFKHVNETMGHQQGDQLLMQVAQRLQATLDNTSILARIGGDEFAIFLVHHDEAERVAMQVVEAMEDRFELGGRNFFTTASLGISLYPQHGFNSETLLKNADTALHQAKNAGRNNYLCYQPEQSARVEEWVRLEPALRNALANHQFEVYYQPQVDAATGYVSGAEALLRWNHPTEGVLSPAKFIPILEEIGLMGHVGNWVLKQALQQTSIWHQQGFSHFRIAVNIAGAQLLSHRLVEHIEALLAQYSLPAERLELEFVETIVMQHAHVARPLLENLTDLGVRIALDDFGTGYSSLSYLKMLPVQKVKIDQSLVRDIPEDPNDEAIARAVIALGHSLNLSVCAEGVETSEQQQFLKHEQCDQLQGYLISRPISAAAMTTWLQTQLPR